MPRVRRAEQPFWSSLMSFLDDNGKVLERLVSEMCARELSTRDVEDVFQDATGGAADLIIGPSPRSPTGSETTIRPPSAGINPTSQWSTC